MAKGWMVEDTEGHLPLALAATMARRASVAAVRRQRARGAARPTMMGCNREVGMRSPARGGLNGHLTEQEEKVEVCGPEVQGTERPDMISAKSPHLLEVRPRENLSLVAVGRLRPAPREAVVDPVPCF